MSIVGISAAKRMADGLQAKRARHGDEDDEVRWLPTDKGLCEEGHRLRIYRSGSVDIRLKQMIPSQKEANHPIANKNRKSVQNSRAERLPSPHHVCNDPNLVANIPLLKRVTQKLYRVEKQCMHAAKTSRGATSPSS